MLCYSLLLHHRIDMYYMLSGFTPWHGMFTITIWLTVSKFRQYIDGRGVALKEISH